MTASQQRVPEFTLEQINARLTKHGLPPIAQNQVDLIKQYAKREDILSAVADLGYVDEAKTFLIDKMRSAGIIQPANQPSRGHPIEEATGGPRRPNTAPNPASNANSQQRPTQRPPANQSTGRQHTNVSNHPASAPPQRPPQKGVEQRSSTAQNDSDGQQSVPIEERMTTHVYARNNAALCFEADIARSGFKTIALDGAKSQGNNFDWANKTRIQLTKGEIPEVLAVLSGHSTYCEFKNHGPSNNKGFSMARQGEKVYVKVFEKGKPLIGVPIHPQDLFYVYSLFMKRVLDQNPWLDATAVLALVRATQPRKEEPPQQQGHQRNQSQGGYNGR